MSEEKPTRVPETEEERQERLENNKKLIIVQFM